MKKFIIASIVLIVLIAAAWLIFNNTKPSPIKISGKQAIVDRGIIDSMWVQMPYLDRRPMMDGSGRWEEAWIDTTWFMLIRDTATGNTQAWSVDPLMFEIYRPGQFTQMFDSVGYINNLKKGEQETLE